MLKVLKLKNFKKHVKSWVLSNLKSFGVNYLGKSIFNTNKSGNGIVLSPAYRREDRSDFLKSKRPKLQDTISTKWKD